MLILKRKLAPPIDPQPNKPVVRKMTFGGKTSEAAEQMSEREEAALIKVGLAPAKAGLTIIKPFSNIPYGARVRITSDMFPWIETYKPGDEGVVVKRFPAQPSPFTKGPRYDLYQVMLDQERVEGAKLVPLSRWEIVEV